LPTCLVAATGSLADDEANGAGWFIPAGTPAKNFYAGVGVDFARNDAPDANQDGSVTGVSTDETGVGAGLFFGYQVNENLAVQGGYRDLADAEFSGTSSGGPSWAPGAVRTEHEADGWELGIMGRWPVSQRWYALGFVGMFWWESTETYYESAGRSQLKESGSDLTFALGFEFDAGLEDRIVYRFMGTHHRVGDDGYDVNGASAAVVYRFP
jgi:OOP family OmpA-OmpF porin